MSKMRKAKINKMVPLTKRQAEKAKFGTVFVVKDKEFNRKSPSNKTRRVVKLGIKNGSLLIAPIKHTSPTRMELKNFDGGRSVFLDKRRYISKNKVYKLNGLNKNNNDYLTTKEKIELKKRLKRIEQA